MRAENAPQNPIRKNITWPLHISANLILIWTVLKLTVAFYPIRANVTVSYQVRFGPDAPVTVFYPAYALLNSPVWQWVVLGGLCVMIVLLHAILFYRRLYEKAALSLIIQGSILLFLVHFFSTVSFFSLHLQTLSMNEHTYHLVLTQQRYYRMPLTQDGAERTVIEGDDGMVLTKGSEAKTVRRYYVLECDRFGLRCEHYASAYIYGTGCAEVFPLLESDPTTRRLLLHLDQDPYEVVPSHDPVWIPCSIRGLTR